jgi:GNAT superfamily N-acetyltransferase
MRIESFSPRWEEDVIALILGIQQGEFGVDVTLEDQPDLRRIPDFYQARGGFWLALESGDAGDRLVGTIGLIRFDPERVALRKMFVRDDRRGAAHGVARALLACAVGWCEAQGVREVWLGTVSILHAAQRFYAKNDFESVAADDLPATFPRMAVDTHFYRRRLRPAPDTP